MISASYYDEMAIALPGQVSDTSKYNIDAACVLGGAATVPCGYAVAVSSAEAVPGHKVMEAMAQGKTAYGVAIRSHFATTNNGGHMVYLPGDGINVITSGRVWMEAVAKFSPAFGTPVRLDNDGRVKSDGEVQPTGWTFAGGVTEFKGIHLVEVQLHQL